MYHIAVAVVEIFYRTYIGNTNGSLHLRNN